MSNEFLTVLFENNGEVFYFHFKTAIELHQWPNSELFECWKYQ